MTNRHHRLLMCLVWIATWVTLDSVPIAKRLNIHRELGDAGDTMSFRRNEIVTPDSCALMQNARYNASREASSLEGPVCQCVPSRPLFDQFSNQCSNQFAKYSACEQVIEFGLSNSVDFVSRHKFYFPLYGQTVNPNNPLNFKKANIDVDQVGFVDCAVSETATLDTNGWKSEVANFNQAFRLVNDTKSITRLKFFGSSIVGSYLQGKQVTLTLRCPSHISLATHCIQFAVTGTDSGEDFAHVALRVSASETHSQAAQQTVSNEPAKATAPLPGQSDVVALICGIMLVLTLVGAAMLWVVCWRFHKDRLARRIQLQILYQQRLQASQIYNDFARSHSPYFQGIDIQVSDNLVALSQQAAADSHDSGLGDSTMTQSEHCAPSTAQSHTGAEFAPYAGVPSAMLQNHYNQHEMQPPPPYPTKKKLYFSPEFFDQNLMESPPPVAEEFLYEVRRMIDIAKNRIRSRRYVPHLMDITEEANNPQQLDCIQEEDELCLDEAVCGTSSARTDTNSPGHSSSSTSDSNHNSQSPCNASSQDSGFASPSKTESSTKEEKVKHWLDKLPEEIEVEESQAGCSVADDEAEPEPTSPSNNNHNQKRTIGLLKYFQSNSAAGNHKSSVQKNRTSPLIQEPDTGAASSPMNSPLKSSALMRRYGISPAESPSTDAWARHLGNTQNGTGHAQYKHEHNGTQPTVQVHRGLPRTEHNVPVHRHPV